MTVAKKSEQNSWKKMAPKKKTVAEKTLSQTAYDKKNVPYKDDCCEKKSKQSSWKKCTLQKWLRPKKTTKQCWINKWNLIKTSLAKKIGAKQLKKMAPYKDDCAKKSEPNSVG